MGWDISAADVNRNRYADNKQEWVDWVGLGRNGMGWDWTFNHSYALILHMR